VKKDMQTATVKKLILAAIGLYVLSGIYFVQPDEQAVVQRFGRVLPERVQPGVHYRFPFPIDRVNKLKVRQVRQVTVGAEVADRTLGQAPTRRAEFLTGDQNLVNVVMTVQYTIADPVAYLFHAKDVESLIAKAAEAGLAHAVAERAVDSLLTTGKVEAQNAVRQTAQNFLDRQYNVGITISAVTIGQPTPPAEVADAFRDVASARADRDRIINEAQAYANDIIPRARGEAKKMSNDAEAYRTKKINEAKGDAARFTKLAAEYAKAKQVTSDRLYIEAMEEILPKVRKLVVDPKSGIDLGVIKQGEGGGRKGK
jgi:membrane protease subunit HflK